MAAAVDEAAAAAAAADDDAGASGGDSGLASRIAFWPGDAVKGIEGRLIDWTGEDTAEGSVGSEGDVDSAVVEGEWANWSMAEGGAGRSGDRTMPESVDMARVFLFWEEERGKKAVNK